MRSNLLNVLKVTVGALLGGLTYWFVFHHGLLILGLLAIPAAYLLWAGVRGLASPSRALEPRQ